MAVNLYGMMMDGLKLAEQGRADNQKSRLGVLASQVYTAPREQRTGLVGQMAALDPEMAAKTQTSVSGIDEAMRKQLADGAGAVVMAPPEMRAEVYRQMVPLGRQLGLPVSPEWNDSLLPHMQRLAGIKDETPAEITTLRMMQKDPSLMETYRARQDAGREPKGFDGVWDTERGVWIPKPGAIPTGGASGLLDGSFESAVGPLLKREGGYVANDAGAGPTNFGINSRANPDVNVASLDANGASEIYRQRYWNAIGADSLPPQIRNAAFDTAVNMGPEVAKQLVQQSGGDPQRFAALRQQRYDSLVAKNPQKYGPYAGAWANRNRETAGLSAIPVAGVQPKQKEPKAAAEWQQKIDYLMAQGVPKEQAIQSVLGGKSQRISVNPETGEITIEDGVSGGLTKTNQTKVQADLIDAQDALAQLARVGTSVSDNYLTATGVAKGVTGRAMDRLGMKNGVTEFNAKRGAALQEVEQFFNKYRKLITGAAAAESELKALREATINSSLGPQEFKARYDALLTSLSNDIGRKRGQLGGQQAPSFSNVQSGTSATPVANDRRRALLDKY